MTDPRVERRRPQARWDMVLRDRIEEHFRDWAYVAGRRRTPIIVGMLTLAAALGLQLPALEVDTSTHSFLRRNDPARVAYDAFREQFGSDQLIVIALRPERVFAPAFLERLAELHGALEREVPHLEEVTSLLNVRETRGDGDELIVRDLLEGWPLGAAELRQVRKRALANPLYRNFVLSGDGHTTTLVVELQTLVADPDGLDALAGFDATDASTARDLSGEEETAAVDAIFAIVERFEDEALEIHVAGGPVLTARLTAQMSEDMQVFLVLSLVAVGGFLFLLFRRASAVVLPLGVVALSVASTFGVMAVVGTPLGLPTQILPSFLLAVGVGGTVHLLTVFYRHFDAGASPPDALARALHHSGLAIVMTALTTAGGLVSFVVAEIQPVADLGIFAPIGIGLGVTYGMVLLPAVLLSVPLKRRSRQRRAGPDRIERTLVWVGDRCVQRPKTVVACMAVVLVLAFAGITRLEFNYDPVRWFPPSDPIRHATEFSDRELGGAISLEVLVDSRHENGLHEPAFLRRLDALRAEVERIEGGGGVRVGKSVSLVDVSREIHQALNENRPEYYAIPESRRLIAQELLLFESSGSDDLGDVTDTMFRTARLTLRLPYAAPQHYQPFIGRVEDIAAQTLGPDVDVAVTGFVSLMSRSLDAVARSLRSSYLFALAIVTPLMFLLLGTLRTGVAAMVPNLAPIALTLGLMGWLGIPLDTFTLMIGSIAIGLAVDDTIHFMHGFRRFHDQLDDTPEAVRRTLRTTGHALLVTSLVLSLSFLVYAFASLDNLVRFGLITGFTIAAAFIADVTVSPALMALSTRGDQLAGRRHAALRLAWERLHRRLVLPQITGAAS